MFVCRGEGGRHGGRTRYRTPTCRKARSIKRRALLGVLTAPLLQRPRDSLVQPQTGGPSLYHNSRVIWGRAERDTRSGGLGARRHLGRAPAGPQGWRPPTSGRATGDMPCRFGEAERARGQELRVSGAGLTRSQFCRSRAWNFLSPAPLRFKDLRLMDRCCRRGLT